MSSATDGRVRWGIALLVYSLLGALTRAQAEDSRLRVLCPGLYLRSEAPVDLSGLERRLVCGDLDGTGPGAEAWRHVPLSQARVALRPMLQQRGLREAAIRQEAGRTVIDVLPAIRVRSWRIEGPTEEFVARQSARRRRVVGELMTPALLDELEGWVAARLRAEGHACPWVRADADADRGEVVLKAVPGAQSEFGELREDPVQGVKPGILRRYDAFQRGARFNHDLLTLTERRILSAGVVESAHFSIDCSEPEHPEIRQEFVSGPPRLLSLGFGTNAEGVLLVRGGWSHQRLGAAASSLRLGVLASFREQTLDLQGAWYLLSRPSRFHLAPGFSAQLRDERYFSENTAAARLEAASAWDSTGLGAEVRLGPSFEAHRTIRGLGPSHAGFLLLGGEIRFSTHDWEFQKSSPRSGLMWIFGSSGASNAMLSDASLWRLRSLGEALWNWKDFDPALLVLALRAGAETTWTPESALASRVLPPSFRQFLGGARTLRGFGRNELPGDEAGGLSSVYGGFEGRLLTVLPWNLEPFVFVDGGALGRESFTLGAPFYWSPGFGLRWEGPAGSLRATLAHGEVSDGPRLNSEGVPLSHLQFYFSFGEEF